MTPLSPLPSRTQRTSLGDHIRDTLEDEIVTGVRSAGSRVDEQELMDRFKVSRTPAREAILQLVSAGLLTPVPRQGAIVASLSLTEYVAMLEILTSLEALSARLAARRMPLTRRVELKQAHEQCRAAAERDDPLDYGLANRRFHEIIYDGSLNEVLARQLRAMRLRMRHPVNTLFERPNRMRNSLAEHQHLLDAILNGDEDAACSAMTRHISSGGNVYADSIASMSPVAPSP